ncbi:ATP synthase subunit delta [Poriferisphaera corsica]|uniref:ATP synthase subunit delta n=1 Tax=Poriferisphaera corsica TaxID=2528020 RepID=A0A517YRJ1_9BACT|nr:ATP synthase F1 subunit delta [Poriferisphaera corsica]QDU32837.1 ATP synthase subunit delta [Poriferisphaera corsica]
MALKKQEMTDAVSEVYARALIEIAEEHGELDTVAGELNELAAVIEQEPDMMRIMRNLAISKREKAGFIERVFRGRFSDTMYKFLQVVNEKDRLVSLAGMVTAYDELLREKRNVVKVEAWVARELDSSEIDRVAQSIGESLGGKTVELELQVDESLIGGLKIRVGDKLIDASVSSQLNLMQQRLVKVGREKAREAAATL